MVPHGAAGGRAVPAAAGSPAAGPAPVVPPAGVGAPDDGADQTIAHAREAAPLPATDRDAEGARPRSKSA